MSTNDVLLYRNGTPVIYTTQFEITYFTRQCNMIKGDVAKTIRYIYKQRIN